MFTAELFATYCEFPLDFLQTAGVLHPLASDFTRNSGAELRLQVAPSVDQEEGAVLKEDVMRTQNSQGL